MQYKLFALAARTVVVDCPQFFDLPTKKLIWIIVQIETRRIRNFMWSILLLKNNAVGYIWGLGIYQMKVWKLPPTHLLSHRAVQIPVDPTYRPAFDLIPTCWTSSLPTWAGLMIGRVYESWWKLGQIWHGKWNSDQNPTWPNLPKSLFSFIGRRKKP